MNNQVDEDNNDQIDFAEFVNLMKAMESQSTADQELELLQAFKVLSFCVEGHTRFQALKSSLYNFITDNNFVFSP